MIIENLWQRINFLVPEPQCKTLGDESDDVEWNDERPQPTVEELQAVTQGEINGNDPTARRDNARQLLKNRQPGNIPVTWDDLNTLLDALDL